MTRMPPLYAGAHRTVGALLRTLWPTTVTGLENIPAGTGAILCPNHHAIADQLFLAVNTPRHIAFWAKAEYFRAPGARGSVTRRVVTGMGAIPVERAGGRAVLTAFDAAIPILYKRQVPVIPVGIRGTDQIRPADRRLPRRRPISLSFGPPIPVKVESAPDARRLTDELIAAIQSLTGQQYVPSYAPPRTP